MSQVIAHTIRIRVGLAVVENGQILLVPHYDTDAGPVQWGIPGGQLQYGESLQEAARREFEEETGLRADIVRVLDVSEVILPNRPYHSITIAFSGRVRGGQEGPEPNHPYGAKSPRWFSMQELTAVRYHPEGTVARALGLQRET